MELQILNLAVKIVNIEISNLSCCDAIIEGQIILFIINQLLIKSKNLYINKI